MTKLHKPELTDEQLVMLMTGLDLIARNLGAGQQQTGLAGIAEVRQKSAPVLALAEYLQGFLPKPPAPHDGPPAANPKPPATSTTARPSARKR